MAQDDQGNALSAIYDLIHLARSGEFYTDYDESMAVLGRADEGFAYLSALVHADPQDDDEVTLRGHKLFVSRGRNGVLVEAVTDDRPLTRMEFHLSDDEWREFAAMLD